MKYGCIENRIKLNDLKLCHNFVIEVQFYEMYSKDNYDVIQVFSLLIKDIHSEKRFLRLRYIKIQKRYKGLPMINCEAPILQYIA